MKSAIRVLRFLHGIHFKGYSRERTARACGIDVATVTRALSKLVDSGAISRTRGGRKTPAKLVALMGLDEFLRRYQEMRRYPGQNAPLSVEIAPLSVPTLRNARASGEDLIQIHRKPPQRAEENYNPETIAEMIREGARMGFGEDEVRSMLAVSGLRKAAGA